MGLFSATLIIAVLWSRLGWFWGLLALVIVLADNVLDSIIKGLK